MICVACDRCNYTIPLAAKRVRVKVHRLLAGAQRFMFFIDGLKHVDRLLNPFVPGFLDMIDYFRVPFKSQAFRVLTKILHAEDKQLQKIL